MAPERLRAVAEGRSAFAAQVDERADIYSLGMVLYEMVAGCLPFTQTDSYSPQLPEVQAMASERESTTPSLRARRPEVPWALESIARKCLSPHPSQRYQSAEHLAEDLKRFLDDSPLKYAPELSLRERAAKWLRRHPWVTSSGTVATVAALFLTAGAALFFGRLSAAQGELRTLQVQEQVRRYEEGTTRALCLVNTTAEGVDNLRNGLAACEEALALYGVLDYEDWHKRPSWLALAADLRQRLGEDARELLLLLAWGRLRGAPNNPEAIAAALALLGRAEAIRDLPPSRALWEDRARYLALLGDKPGAEAAQAHASKIEPTTACDHYQLATSLAHDGRYAAALVELEQALQLSPRHYWSATQRGICHQEQGNYVLAAGDFGVCIGLWPESPWGYFTRAYALEQSGERVEAIPATTPRPSSATRASCWPI
jgi:tetratricopeptide (TPR) repeat protein